MTTGKGMTRPPWKRNRPERVPDLVHSNQNEQEKTPCHLYLVYKVKMSAQMLWQQAWVEKVTSIHTWDCQLVYLFRKTQVCPLSIQTNVTPALGLGNCPSRHGSSLEMHRKHRQSSAAGP